MTYTINGKQVTMTNNVMMKLHDNYWDIDEITLNLPLPDTFEVYDCDADTVTLKYNDELHTFDVEGDEVTR